MLGTRCPADSSLLTARILATTSEHVLELTLDSATPHGIAAQGFDILGSDRRVQSQSIRPPISWCRQFSGACGFWTNQLPKSVVSLAATAAALLLLCFFVGRGTAFESADAVATSHSFSQTAQRLPVQSIQTDLAAVHQEDAASTVMLFQPEGIQSQLQREPQPRKLSSNHPAGFWRQQLRGPVNRS